MRPFWSREAAEPLPQVYEKGGVPRPLAEICQEYFIFIPWVLGMCWTGGLCQGAGTWHPS